MRTSDFDYPLPADRIAQQPAEPRDSSRLLVMDRRAGTLSHRFFHDLPDLLRPGDLIVVNKTRVLPARLAAREAGSRGKAELLLIRRVEPRVWEALIGGRRVRTGARLALADGSEAEILQDLGGPRRLVRFDRPITPRLARLGQTPLPPYIHEPLADPDRYQTVYGRVAGSVAAPTAGLHFTKELIARLRALGVAWAEVTLHVGLDTFAPVEEDDPMRHPIHAEWCQVGEETVAAVRRARRNGGRIVAVGTTTARALESGAGQAAPGDILSPFAGLTRLFITPGFAFQVVDVLITNFHLPRSTLMMLVSAFAGREALLAAYRAAVEAGYRFYSFGDAMLIE